MKRKPGRPTLASLRTELPMPRLVSGNPAAFIHIFQQPDGTVSVRGGGEKGTTAYALMQVLCRACEEGKG